MDNDRAVTIWSEATIREALRLAEAAYERNDDELFGLDRAGIFDAVQILDGLAARCHDGRFTGELDPAGAPIVRPLIEAARKEPWTRPHR